MNDGDVVLHFEKVGASRTNGHLLCGLDEEEYELRISTNYVYMHAVKSLMHVVANTCER